MKTLRHISVVLLTAAVLSPLAGANLLTDPGFESNPLTTAGNVLNNFTTWQGVWGVESAAITGPENSVTPAQGAQMLRMTDDGLSWTQGFQVVDVTSYAALIDSSSATVNVSALANAHPRLSAPLGNVSVLFFTAANWVSLTGALTSNLVLDALPSTWETISTSGTVPVLTRWMMVQVAFQNASLLASDGTYQPGYIDAARLTIIPEPATLVLLSLGALVLRKTKTVV
jgi:hypothetical protein